MPNLWAISSQSPGLVAEDCPVRDVLDRLGGAWTLLVILYLGDQTARFNQLKRAIEGISQRMLTVTLRNLERDGLVRRKVIPTTPPQVEYSLTERGQSLAIPISSLTHWAAKYHQAIKHSRIDYDAKKPKSTIRRED